MMSIAETVAIASALIALAALAFNVVKDRRASERDGQALKDRLDYISTNTRDIRDDVRALDRKLDDHAARITKMEARMDDHGRRIERLEQVQ